jgi:putative phosphoesterase
MKQAAKAMRVAALYDIHGNLPALEAVLQEVARANVDQVVVGGDVLPGPMPHEAIARLVDLEVEVPVHFIRGNGDRETLAFKAGNESGVPEPYREVMRWTAQQLGPEDERLLKNWPLTARLAIHGLGDVLFCHGTPRDDNEIFTRLTSVDRLKAVFEGLNVQLVVCGHTHMQFDRMVGAVRVVNAGSVGMPFGKTGADWLLLGPDVELKHTDYDLADAAQRIRQTSYPQAAELSDNYILKSPSEEEILTAFTRAELK